MLCRDAGPDNYWPIECPRCNERADKLTRVACDLARTIEANMGVIQDTTSALSKETRDWWREHKEADRRREEAEAKARRIRKVKQEALGKLTPEERKALGL